MLSYLAPALAPTRAGGAHRLSRRAMMNTIDARCRAARPVEDTFEENASMPALTAARFAPLRFAAAQARPCAPGPM
jgi:hypothetical protein